MSVPEWWLKPRTVSVVVDNNSWILPYAEMLVDWCRRQGDAPRLCRTHEDIALGTVAFFLGCIKLAPPDALAKNSCNLVVHESDLPRGKGFAPVAWQILEGKDEIPVCLLYAGEKADAGPIVYRDIIRLEGHELCPEWRDIQGFKAVELCQRFLKEESPPKGIPQRGKDSFYPRRGPEDSRLDPKKSLSTQFDLLRVVDNERYPAFFDFRGQRYRLLVTKEDNG